MAGVKPYTHDDWKKTHADLLRALSDEELAEFIANAVDCCNCKHPRNGCSENDETCAACWLDWLKQEVEA